MHKNKISKGLITNNNFTNVSITSKKVLKILYLGLIMDELINFSDKKSNVIQ